MVETRNSAQVSAGLAQVLNSLTQKSKTSSHELDASAIHAAGEQFKRDMAPATYNVAKKAFAVKLLNMYNDMLVNLQRTFKTETTTDGDYDASNVAYNDATKRYVQAFDTLLEDETPDGSGNNNPHQYGLRMNSEINNMNAFEAVLAMTLGGVSKTAPTSTGGNNGDNAYTSMGSAQTLQFVTTNSGSSNNQLLVGGMEARAVLILMMWSKFCDGAEGTATCPILFGNGKHQIIVKQYVHTGSNGVSGYDFCRAELSGSETEKRFNIVADSTEGKNWLASTFGGLLATVVASTTGTGEKFMGGEASYSVEAVERLVASQLRGDRTDGITSVQMKTIFPSITGTKRASTSNDLDKLQELGFDTLADIGIVINKEKTPTATDFPKETGKAQTFGSSTTDLAGASAQDGISTSGSGTFVAGSTTDTKFVTLMNERLKYFDDAPYLDTILRHPHYGNLLLQGLLLKTGNTGLDFTAGPGAAVILGSYTVNNATWTVRTTANNETPGLAGQQWVTGLALINKALESKDLKKFDSWSDILKSDNQDDTTTDENDKIEISDVFVTWAAGTSWYGALQSGSALINLRDGAPGAMSPLTHELYWRDALDNKNPLVGTEATSSDLILLQKIKTGHADILDEIVKDALKQSVIAGPQNFKEDVIRLVQHAEKTGQGYSTYNSPNGENIHTVFGSDASTTTTFGNVFGADMGPTDFSASREGLIHDIAAAFWVVYSELTATEKKNLLKYSPEHVADYIAPLYKYEEEKLSATGTVEKYARVTALKLTDIVKKAGATVALPMNSAGNFIDNALLGLAIKADTSDATKADLTNSFVETLRDEAKDAIVNGLFFAMKKNKGVKTELRLKVINRYTLCASDIITALGKDTNLYDFSSQTSPASAFSKTNDALTTAIGTNVNYHYKTEVSAIKQVLELSGVKMINTSVKSQDDTANHHLPLVTHNGLDGGSEVADMSTQADMVKLINKLREVLCDVSAPVVNEFVHAMAELAGDRTKNNSSTNEENVEARSIIAAITEMIFMDGKALPGVTGDINEAGKEKRDENWVGDYMHMIAQLYINTHADESRLSNTYQVTNLGSANQNSDDFGTINNVLEAHRDVNTLAKVLADCPELKASPKETVKVMLQSTNRTKVAYLVADNATDGTSAPAYSGLIPAGYFLSIINNNEIYDRPTTEDQPGRPAGLSGDNVRMLIEAGGVTEKLYDMLVPIKTSVGSGVSYKYDLAVQRMVAVDDNSNFVEPVSIDENGASVYQPIDFFA